MKLKLGGLFKYATSCGIGRDSTHDHNTPLVRPMQGIPQIKLRSQGPGPKTLTDIKLYRFNLAICGGHKAGKTAMINALLHAKHGPAGGAAAGTVGGPPGLYEYPLPGDSPTPVSLWEVPALKPEAGDVTYDSTLFAFSAVLVVTPGSLQRHDVQVIQAALANRQPVVLVRSRADETVGKQTGCNFAAAVEHLRGVVIRDLEAALGPAALQQVPAFLVGGGPTPASGTIGPAGAAAPRHNTIDEGRLLHWIYKAARHAGQQTSGLQEQHPDSSPRQEQRQMTQHTNTAYQAGHPAPSAPQSQSHPGPAGVRDSSPVALPSEAHGFCPTAVDASLQLAQLQTKPGVTGPPTVPRPGARPAPYRIAVFGAPMAGTSSLIQLLVGMQGGATGAAADGAMQGPSGLYEYCLPGDFPTPGAFLASVWDLYEVPVLKPQAGRAAYETTLRTFSAVLVVTPDTLKSHDVQVIQAALAQHKPVVVVRSRADEAVRNIVRQHRCDPAAAVEHLRGAMAHNINTELGPAAADRVWVYLMGEELYPPGCGINPAAGGAAPCHSIKFDEDSLLRWINKTAGDAGKPTQARQEQQPATKAVQEQQAQRHSPARQAGHPAPSAPQLQSQPGPAGVHASTPLALPSAAHGFDPTATDASPQLAQAPAGTASVEATNLYAPPAATGGSRTAPAGMVGRGPQQTKPGPAAKSPARSPPDARHTLHVPDQQRQQQQQKTQRADTAYQLVGPLHAGLAAPIATQQVPHSMPAAGHHRDPHTQASTAHSQRTADPAVQEVPPTRLLD